jgi:hypothetical protein
LKSRAVSWLFCIGLGSNGEGSPFAAGGTYPYSFSGYPIRTNTTVSSIESRTHLNPSANGFFKFSSTSAKRRCRAGAKNRSAAKIRHDHANCQLSLQLRAFVRAANGLRSPLRSSCFVSLEVSPTPCDSLQDSYSIAWSHPPPPAGSGKFHDFFASPNQLLVYPNQGGLPQTLRDSG